jgi:hypothetical protein
MAPTVRCLACARSPDWFRRRAPGAQLDLKTALRARALIPFALDVCCVGFEVQDRPYLDRSRASAKLLELEGLYGIDFGAFRHVLENQPDLFRRTLWDVGQTQFEPRILTDETQLYHLDS